MFRGQAGIQQNVYKADIQVSNTGCLEGRQTGIQHRMFRRQADRYRYPPNRMFMKEDRYPTLDVYRAVRYPTKDV